jgi:tripartite-type tricarboxylate transporter receptor subunit TctC
MKPVLAAAATSLLLLAPGLYAQAFPSKTVRLVATSVPGSPVDIYARAISDQLAKSLGQAVVVENRAGAGAALGAQAVARAAPDGYTLLLGTYLDQAAVLALMRELAYDPERDFVAVAPMGRSCTVLLVCSS